MHGDFFKMLENHKKMHDDNLLIAINMIMLKLDLLQGKILMLVLLLSLMMNALVRLRLLVNLNIGCHLTIMMDKTCMDLLTIQIG